MRQETNDFVEKDELTAGKEVEVTTDVPIEQLNRFVSLPDTEQLHRKAQSFPQFIRSFHRVPVSPIG